MYFCKSRQVERRFGDCHCYSTLACLQDDKVVFFKSSRVNLRTYLVFKAIISSLVYTASKSNDQNKSYEQLNQTAYNRHSENTTFSCTCGYYAYYLSFCILHVGAIATANLIVYKFTKYVCHEISKSHFSVYLNDLNLVLA